MIQKNSVDPKASKEKNISLEALRSQKNKYKNIALVLQGGGGLGAYQAGVYEVLSEYDLSPNLISGISIGAINAAIIAGNAPKNRVAALQNFWETISQTPVPTQGGSLIWDMLGRTLPSFRSCINTFYSGLALTFGQKGFFTPRIPPNFMQQNVPTTEASFYDTKELKTSLERFADFDRINSREIRVAVGAVNVNSGNFVYFDNANIKLRAEHFMASGALPPGFPAVEIDGEFYWDGGLVSNSPLSFIVDMVPRHDSLIFQVDLWSAIGHLPQNIGDVLERQKEIQYSSRTRFVTNEFVRLQKVRNELSNIIDSVADDKRIKHINGLLASLACPKLFNIVHLIYQSKLYENHAKDYEFSIQSMREHWAAGADDMRRTLQVPGVLNPPAENIGVVTHDVHRHNQNKKSNKKAAQNG